MACGNIVIGKIPESEPEWMFEDNVLKDNGLWYYNTNDVHALIAKAVQTYLYNAVPSEMYSSMEKLLVNIHKTSSLRMLKKFMVELLQIVKKN